MAVAARSLGRGRRGRRTVLGRLGERVDPGGATSCRCQGEGVDVDPRRVAVAALQQRASCGDHRGGTAGDQVQALPGGGRAHGALQAQRHRPSVDRDQVVTALRGDRVHARRCVDRPQSELGDADRQDGGGAAEPIGRVGLGDGIDREAERRSGDRVEFAHQPGGGTTGGVGGDLGDGQLDLLARSAVDAQGDRRGDRVQPVVDHVHDELVDADRFGVGVLDPLARDPVDRCLVGGQRIAVDRRGRTRAQVAGEPFRRRGGHATLGPGGHTDQAVHDVVGRPARQPRPAVGRVGALDGALDEPAHRGFLGGAVRLDAVAAPAGEQVGEAPVDRLLAGGIEQVDRRPDDLVDRPHAGDRDLGEADVGQSAEAGRVGRVGAVDGDAQRVERALREGHHLSG